MKEVYIVTKGFGDSYKILAVFQYERYAKDFVETYNKALDKKQEHLKARIEYHLLIGDVWGYELIENINLENEEKQTVYDGLTPNFGEYLLNVSTITWLPFI